MNIITIRPEARYYLGMSLDEAKLVLGMAKTHYDMTCRQAALQGGFIYGWVNKLTPINGFTPEEIVTATFRELDTVLKVLEFRHLPAEKLDTVLKMDEFIRTAIRIGNEQLRPLEFNIVPLTTAERVKLLHAAPIVDNGDHFEDPDHMLEIYRVPKFGLKKE